jgi:hypothetical protein|tara:strand:+ start:24 stop:320 length:297 start_codon:yes stop_codon:yes gene_type:complete
MTHTELNAYIKKVFPDESNADIALHLTEASRDFTSRTKILKGVETFNTVIDQRYYDLNDLDGDDSETDQRHIVEVNKVDYDNYTIQRLITPPDEVDIT